MTTTIHLAQANIARMRTPFEDDAMAGFRERLDEINALADGAKGFVWRLQTGEGNATYLRPFDDDRMLFNLSVWEGLEHLKEYVYRTAHAELLRQRQQWFERLDRPLVALWWVPAGHRPSVDEAKKRLDRLQAEGPTPFAFTFRDLFPPDPALVTSTDGDGFVPCPAG